jgi:hypothetical protein
MKIKTLLLIVTMLIVRNSFAQKEELPVIKANAITVDIKDDDVLKKEAWRIVPEKELDVYTTSAKKKVTFYTDIDSFGRIRTTQKRESTNQETGVKYIHYKTNNPDLFWTKPK